VGSSFGAAFDWLGVQRAWTRTRGSPDVVIAIVGEGVQADHPLLGPNIKKDLARASDPSDSRELAGTHAAGVAAGRHSEVDEFSGVAPGARLLPVRFAAQGTEALDLAHALEYAVEMGACIINVAHGADVSATGTQRALKYAATRNVLVVCSAGDAGAECVPEDAAPNILRVVSVDEHCRPVSDRPTAAAHIAAPGFARVPRWKDSGHSVLHGAALGAPYVSGCAALVKTVNPGWGYHEIKEHLLSSGTPQPQLAGHTLGGLLNVGDAVLGPLEHEDGVQSLSWSALNDAQLHWKMRYRSALCVNAVALYRPHGDEHWRELGFARASTLRMTVPAAALRRSSGTLRLGCRESSFHANDIELTIR
jgi:subtilisin family serine protease